MLRVRRIDNGMHTEHGVVLRVSAATASHSEHEIECLLIGHGQIRT